MRTKEIAEEIQLLSKEDFKALNEALSDTHRILPIKVSPNGGTGTCKTTGCPVGYYCADDGNCILQVGG